MRRCNSHEIPSYNQIVRRCGRERRCYALLVCLWVGGVSAFSAPVFAADAPQCVPLSFADIAEQTQPAVVNISTASIVFMPGAQESAPPSDDKLFQWFFDSPASRPGFRRRSLGSGVIIDQAGFIITNNHVIEGADEIQVKLSNGEEFEATIVGRDVKTDVALIKITADARTFPVARMGNSDVLRVGEWVMAVGNPYGLSHTVTAGIVSAKGRVIGGPYDDFIQTDTSINPGNSGGPLINIQGEVIGINTAIFANVQGNYFAQGIGFAIPINIVNHVVHDLRQFGKVQRGWLGVMIQDVTPELAASFNLPNTRGALIANLVPGGPADKAGLKRGDVVLRFDAVDIRESIDLPRTTADALPGTTSVLLVNRDGEEIALTVVLGEFPEVTSQTTETPTFSPETIGMEVQPLTPQLAQQFGVSTQKSGIIVTQVHPGSPADTAQVQSGDLLSEVNRIAVQTLDEYQQALELSQQDRIILLLISRGGETVYTMIKLDAEE